MGKHGKRTQNKKQLFRAAAAAVLLTLLAGSGLLYRLNRQLEDALSQVGKQPDEKIMVVGVDAYALQEIGNWPWNRSVMAEILNILNQDPDNAPGVIGVDVVYAGETDPDSDRKLAQAAAAGNVVMACTVEFGSGIVLEADGTAYMDAFSVSYPAFPYEALKENARVGHVNAMYDRDGVIRHHLWEIQLGDETIQSMPGQLYELYCENIGEEPDFQPKTDARGFWRVDFTGKPGDYYYCSAADILYGDYDPEMFADAVVLIGPYETSMSDDFVTSADRAKRMYGVEYLANVTAAVFSGRQKTEVSDILQRVVLFGGLLLMAIWFQRTKKMSWAFVAYVVSVAASLMLFLVFYHFGAIWHPLWFPAAVSILFVLGVVERYLRTVAERYRITKTFQRYVDPHIIKELLQENSESLGLVGKTMDIAVLFVDIRGFTTMSEQMEPEEIVKILNEYLTLTSRCVMKRGGTVDKFVGDCTMAFWGAPLECEDPVYKACLAAKDIALGAEPLNSRLFERFGRKVGFGVGVHYGPAVVGNIGSMERMDYTAIGDTVNTAARLEANAPAGTVYISRIVADMLGDRAETTSLGGSVTLKGKAEGFEVLRLERLEVEKADLE